jgi:ATP-binding cassette subfamily B protein
MKTNIKALKTSLSVKKGETLAILGKQGLEINHFSLISRLYDVTDGKITIDNQEIF